MGRGGQVSLEAIIQTEMKSSCKRERLIREQEGKIGCVRGWEGKSDPRRQMARGCSRNQQEAGDTLGGGRSSRQQRVREVLEKGRAPPGWGASGRARSGFVTRERRRWLSPWALPGAQALGSWAVVCRWWGRKQGGTTAWLYLGISLQVAHVVLLEPAARCPRRCRRPVQVGAHVPTRARAYASSCSPPGAAARSR